MQQLVREIAFMVVLAILGTLDLVFAPVSSRWWLALINIIFALLAYFIAWLSYKDARKIARTIDAPIKITLIDLKPSESSDLSDTSEDLGHPI